MYNAQTKEFDKPNIQSDTDKLSKRMLCVFLLLIFTIIRISTMFNIVINSPKDSSADLFSFASDSVTHAHGVIDVSVNLVV